MVAFLTKIFDADNVTGVTNDQFTLGAGASKVVAVNTNDGETGYIHDNNAGSSRAQGFHIDGNFTERMSKVLAVRIRGWMRNDPDTDAIPGNKWRLRLGGSLTESAVFEVDTAGGYVEYVSASLARPGGGTWSEEDFRAATFEYEILTPSDSGDLRITYLKPETDYEPGIPDAQNQAINRGSRIVRMFTGAAPMLELDVPPKCLKLELMDEVLVYDRNVPMAESLRERIEGLDGSGEGFDGVYGRVAAHVLDMDKDAVRLVVPVLGDYRTLHWHSERADDVNNLNRGHAALVNGATHEFTRSSFAFIEDASAGSRGIAKLSMLWTDVPKRNHKGVLCNEPTDQLLLNTNFRDGSGPATNWVYTTNSQGTITDAAGNVLFDEETHDQVGGRTITMDRDTGTASAMIVRQDASVSADEAVHFPFWYRNIAFGGATPGSNIVRAVVQRTSDSFYWNFATGGWQAGYADATPAISADKPARAVQAPIVKDGSTGTVRFQIVMSQSGAAVGDIVELYHANVTEGALVQPDMVRNSDFPAALVGSPDDYYYQLDNGSDGTDRMVFHPQRYTYRFTLVAEQDGAWDWSQGSADQSTCGLALINKGFTDIVTGTASDFDAVALQQTAPGSVRLLFLRYVSLSQSGTAANFSFGSFDRGTEYEVAVRVTGDSPGGELGLADLSADVFVDGVRGTRGTFGAAHAQSTKSQLFVGTRPPVPAAAASIRASNWIRNRDLQPIAIPDEAILAGRTL